MRSKDVQLGNQHDQQRLLELPLYSLVQLSIDNMMLGNFREFGEIIERYNTETRLALDAKTLPKAPFEKLPTSLQNLSRCEEVIFYQHLHEEKWAIFCLSISLAMKKSTIHIDGYFLGDVVTNHYKTICFAPMYAHCKTV